MISVNRQGILFAIVIYLASSYFGYVGVLASQAIADVLTGIGAMALFYFGLWKEIRERHQ